MHRAPESTDTQTAQTPEREGVATSDEIFFRDVPPWMRRISAARVFHVETYEEFSGTSRSGCDLVHLLCYLYGISIATIQHQQPQERDRLIV